MLRLVTLTGREGSRCLESWCRVAYASWKVAWTSSHRAERTAKHFHTSKDQEVRTWALFAAVSMKVGSCTIFQAAPSGLHAATLNFAPRKIQAPIIHHAGVVCEEIRAVCFLCGYADAEHIISAHSECVFVNLTSIHAYLCRRHCQGLRATTLRFSMSSAAVGEFGVPDSEIACVLDAVVHHSLDGRL
jgi:hypothetical protein